MQTIPGTKEPPILSALGQIQHKCSDQCNYDRSFEETKSNTKGLGLLVHTAAPSSWDQGLLWLLPVNFAKRGCCVCSDVSLVTVSVFQIQFYYTSHGLCLLLKDNLDNTSNHALFTKGTEGVVWQFKFRALSCCPWRSRVNSSNTQAATQKTEQRTVAQTLSHFPSGNNTNSSNYPLEAANSAGKRSYCSATTREYLRKLWNVSENRNTHKKNQSSNRKLSVVQKRRQNFLNTDKQIMGKEMMWSKIAYTRVCVTGWHFFNLSATALG